MDSDTQNSANGIHLPKPPRNIVICCDGTGNEFGATNSNVVRLYTTLVVDEHQLGYYHPGVGTMGAPNARGGIEKEWSRIKGLAFGAGTMANIGDAYRYLMDNYRKDDRIFIFGFSRGAYTARALAGVLHTCGLLCSGNEGLIPYVLDIFAKKSKEKPVGSRTVGIAEQFKDTFSRDVLIHFVGVWDTVSSVGWVTDPMMLPDEGRNPIIAVGRHAISIDERRCYYRDKLWGDPFQPGEPGYRVDQDIRQVWFAGVHSDVGGSYPEPQGGLSKLALEWMLQEAVQFGLRIYESRANMVLGRANPTPAQPPYVQPDPAAMIHDSLKGAWWMLECLPHVYYDKPQARPMWRIPLGARRTIPEGSILHESVMQRGNLLKEYRPPNLPKNAVIEPRRTFPPLDGPSPRGLESTAKERMLVSSGD